MNRKIIYEGSQDLASAVFDHLRSHGLHPEVPDTPPATAVHATKFTYVYYVTVPAGEEQEARALVSAWAPGDTEQVTILTNSLRISLQGAFIPTIFAAVGLLYWAKEYLPYYTAAVGLTWAVSFVALERKAAAERDAVRRSPTRPTTRNGRRGRP